MTYPDSVQFLYSLGNEIRTAKLGLERIARVLTEMDHPERAFRSIHVAGTNGKGSTCAMIESALRAASECTGLFTSPHLLEPTERIRIGGVPVTPDQFTESFQRVHGLAEKLLSAGEIDLHPTYFETVTAMGFDLFRRNGVTTAVVEVGLGGRLDATNVIIPQVAVITPVDYDHEAWLGRTLAAIAGEKAGILKKGVPAVIARQRPEAAEVIDARARELEVHVVQTPDVQVQELTATGARLSCDGLALHCPLAGEHQIENTVTAYAALREFGCPPEAIQQGIAATRWPGRLERVSTNPEIIVDGAHNPSGARALAAHIQRFYAGRRVRLIYGAMRDKAIEEIASILFPVAAEVILTAPAQARAVSPQAMLQIADHPNVRTAADLAAALQLLSPTAPDDVVFITGSLFLVAEAEAFLCR